MWMKSISNIAWMSLCRPSFVPSRKTVLEYRKWVILHFDIAWTKTLGYYVLSNKLIIFIKCSTRSFQLPPSTTLIVTKLMIITDIIVTRFLNNTFLTKYNLVGCLFMKSISSPLIISINSFIFSNDTKKFLITGFQHLAIVIKTWRSPAFKYFKAVSNSTLFIPHVCLCARFPVSHAF